MMLKPAVFLKTEVVKGYARYLSTITPKKIEEKATAFKEHKEKFVQKSCRVAVLGALTTTGKALALLLKQNPLISQIYLYDSENTCGLAADLNHLDTHSGVTGYKNQDVHCAVRNADVIVMLGLETIKPDATFEQTLKIEGKRLIELATASALHAPKAIFVDCVVPLSVTLPIISEVYRRNHWYHPGKVLGSIAQQQMRINTLLAQQQDLDPSCVHVPLLGGPEEDILLPLFSRSSPLPVPLPAARAMINVFRKLDVDASPNVKSEAKHEYAPFGNAFAINRLVSTIALGLLGDSKAISTAFVRTNFVGTCQHLVSTVKFGPHGIMHNFGVPKLTRFELRLFEKMTLELGKREEIAKDFIELNNCDPTQCKGQPSNMDPLYFPATVEFFPPDETIVFDA